MKISELQDGQTVKLRLGRYVDSIMCDLCAVGDAPKPCPKCDGSGLIEATAPVFGQWQDRELYVQRYKDKIVTIALRNGSFAEFDPRHDASPAYTNSQPTGFVMLENEGYYMEIEGLTA